MATSSLDFFRQDTAKGSLTPDYGSLSPDYGPLSGPGAARPSGRSWMDPSRALEREQRLSDRMLRQQAAGGRGGGGGGGGSSQPAPLGTPGQMLTLLPSTKTKNVGNTYSRARLESLGASFKPQLGVYDPRTGLSQPFTQALRAGLLGSAQRALLAGLKHTNPFV